MIRQFYVYGSSERAFLLAAVVPTEEMLTRHGAGSDALKAAIRRSLQQIAEEHGLNGYEIRAIS